MRVEDITLSNLVQLHWASSFCETPSKKVFQVNKTCPEAFLSTTFVMELSMPQSFPVCHFKYPNIYTMSVLELSIYKKCLPSFLLEL